MMLVAVGLNHQTAPIALRERVAVAPESLAQAAAALRATPGVLEAVVVSTCNRTEIYCCVEPGAQAAPAAWLHEFHGLRPSQLDEFLYRHVDTAMVRHLFRVATGLDSMVLGEPQVLGQVKESWQRAREAGSLGNRLDRLFQNAFAVAKRARTETRVGAAPVSVAFAATRLAGQVFGDMAGVSALLVGAGDTIELVARHLVQTGLQRMTVANRTVANAEALAARYDARAIALPDLPRHLHEADLVICSTAAREPVISRAEVRGRAGAAPASPDAVRRPRRAARRRSRRGDPGRRVPLHRRRPRGGDRGQHALAARGRARGRSDHRPAGRALRHLAARPGRPRAAARPAPRCRAPARRGTGAFAPDAGRRPRSRTRSCNTSPAR